MACSLWESHPHLQLVCHGYPLKYKSPISQCPAQILHRSSTHMSAHGLKMPSVAPSAPWTQTVWCFPHAHHRPSSHIFLNVVTWWLEENIYKIAQTSVLALKYSSNPPFLCTPSAAGIIPWLGSINSGLSVSYLVPTSCHFHTTSRKTEQLRSTTTPPTVHSCRFSTYFIWWDHLLHHPMHPSPTPHALK